MRPLKNVFILGLFVKIMGWHLLQKNVMITNRNYNFENYINRIVDRMVYSKNIFIIIQFYSQVKKNATLSIPLLFSFRNIHGCHWNSKHVFRFYPDGCTHRNNDLLQQWTCQKYIFETK